MRNEISSLISHLGSPSWFVTLSPADNKHPICLYFADMNEQFKPEIRTSDDTYRLIANNPVAAARFFNFMCCAFIKNVLGVFDTFWFIWKNLWLLWYSRTTRSINFAPAYSHLAEKLSITSRN